MNSKNCRFCNIINGNYQHKFDQPFFKNNSYIAMASIGALVEGWTLIIPKEHQLSMKSLYSDINFTNFVDNLIPRIYKMYGPLIAFEHGSNKEGSITACGTNHAHLHLVPFSDSLMNDMNKSNMEWIKCRSSEIFNIVGKSEYLFYTEIGTNNIWNDPIGYLHILEFPISQYFRQIIAKKLGHSDKFDYKIYPNADITEQTMLNLLEVSFR